MLVHRAHGLQCVGVGGLSTKQQLALEGRPATTDQSPDRVADEVDLIVVLSLDAVMRDLLTHAPDEGLIGAFDSSHGSPREAAGRATASDPELAPAEANPAL